MTSKQPQATKPGCPSKQGERQKLPLLAPQEFADFSDETWMTYIRSLYVQPKIRTKKALKPAKPKGLSVTLTKKGSLSVRCSRKERTFTQAEFEYFALLTKAPMNLIWNALRKSKVDITPSFEAERRRERETARARKAKRV